MPSVEIKFEYGDKVKILPLENAIGRIRSVWIVQKGITYEVRYFTDGKVNEVYFFEDELEKI